MSEDRGERRPRPRGGRRPRRKVCTFCVDKIEFIDYKDVNRLRRFTNERGKILPRRMSGNCAKHQRQLSEAIKRIDPNKNCSGKPEQFFIFRCPAPRKLTPGWDYGMFSRIIFLIRMVQNVYSQRDPVCSAGTGPDGAVLAFDHVPYGHDDPVAQRTAVLQRCHGQL